MTDIVKSIYGKELLGDTENNGMAATLVAHMVEYRYRAVRQLQTKKNTRRNSIGGAACAIMKYAGVRFSKYRADGKELNKIGFRLMDERYLVAQKMVCRQDTSLYRFIHPDVEEAYIRLPRRDWVSLSNNNYLRNAEFIPPVDELEDPNRGPPSPPPSPPQPFEYNEEQEAPNVQLGQGEPSKKIVSMVQKMKKSFMKKIGKLVLKDKEKRKKITALERRVSELESRQSVEEERRRNSDAELAIMEYQEESGNNVNAGDVEPNLNQEDSGEYLVRRPWRRESDNDDEDILAEQAYFNWESDEEETNRGPAVGPQEPFDPYNTYGDEDIAYRSHTPSDYSPAPVQFPVFPPIYRGPEEEDPPQWVCTSASRRLVLEAPLPPEAPSWLPEPQIQLRDPNTYLPGSPGRLPPTVSCRLWWEEVSDPRWTNRPIQRMLENARETSDQRIPRQQPEVRHPASWTPAPQEWTRNYYDP